MWMVRCRSTSMMIDGGIDDMKFEVGDRVKVQPGVISQSWLQDVVNRDFVIIDIAHDDSCLIRSYRSSFNYGFRCMPWQLKLVHRNSGQKLLELLD